MRKRHLMIAVAAAALAAFTGAAEAGYLGWGPRVGATVDPDQIHFGAHMDFGSRSEPLRFQPNIEMGLGDDLTVLALQGDGIYRFNSNWESWAPYLGGGVGLYLVGGDDGLLDGSDEQAGINFLGGIERGLASGSRFFLEGRLGLIDAPDFKITAGWTFH